ncbi:hypothetical protein CK203_065707 [Vitis vinifera]|uniref:Retrotransposon gag domain-containing protein n=1 Tax=Vitis vinifera TaxID=29760 RepID=A0A438G2H5_VITVI|nr:hypothetical protein CK203_065707 [Vitis vinifera]
MPKWIRDSGGRLVKCDTPHNKEFELSLNIMEATPEDQHSHQGRQDNLNEFRSMRDRMHPPRMSAPSCIVPPTEQLVIRPYLVPLLPTFHGMESENPYAHIKEFEDVCNTFQEGGASIDLMRLKLFPFTLKDKAKIWLNSLRPRSIRSWTDLQAEFLKKFFPTHRTNGLKRQISNFSAKENEKFYECWERYMEAINACPHHGFDTWLLLKFQGDGMNQPKEKWEDEVSTECFNAKAGMYTLKEDDDMKAKLAAMTRRLEELELKRIHEVQAVAEAPVQLKGKCLEIKQMLLDNSSPITMRLMEILTTQVGGIIQISHGRPEQLKYQQPDPPSQQSSSLEQAIANLSKVVGDFVGNQEATNAQINQRIDRVESTLNKRMDGMQNDISKSLIISNIQFQGYKFEHSARKGKISFSTPPKPQGVHEVESQEGESSQMKDVKALITLRSGKKIEKPTPKPHVEKKKKR